jgi:ABC-type polysaccharide/polyol phosphate transport system ATPase subunit
MLSNDIILKAENISKQYRLGQVGTGTLSHDLNRWWHKVRGKENPYLKIGEVNNRSEKGESDYVWALQDINFEVQRGEVLGIIGKNGAGKSTLLKILSRVTAPTTGSIKTKGRIASLLEVGTGFHGEMTGRENIYLNGAILGMTKKEITSKIDEIIEFSGCERYIDTPVKRYSSGMTVRLAFAVAAFLEPEILVVDEVLAVGDAEFQKKAIGKMQDISRQGGRTVLFVSHDMRAISLLCKRSILLNQGSILRIAPTAEIIDIYLNGEDLNSSNFDMKFSLKNDLIAIETLLNEAVSIYDGSFFVKMIDFNGIEIMLYEKKLAKNESIIKKLTLDVSSLNSGVYSLQVKVWASLNSGKSIAFSTPFYPIVLENREEMHKRVFAGKITDII